MSYVEITALKGIRNDVSPERFAPGDLVYARNVDIDETGKATQRGGTEIVFAGPAHSLWSDGQQGFFVQGGILYRFLSDGTKSGLCAVQDLVHYVGINNTVFWTDGVSTGAIREGVNTPWGITPPGACSATPSENGTLLAGDYTVVVTYEDADGRESGASPAAAVIVGVLRPKHDSVGVCGGIEVTIPSPATPGVASANVYVGAAGGAPLLIASVPTGSIFTIDSLDSATVPLRGVSLGAPPAGQLLGYYSGRAYVASGQFLFFSQPFEYDLFNLGTDFIALPGNIRTFSAVGDGIFVGTSDRTYFLDGADADAFVCRVASPYGTISGTEQAAGSDALADGAPGRPKTGTSANAFWMSRRGLVVGSDGGVIKDVTTRRYLPPAASAGGSLLRQGNGSPVYVVSLFN